MLHEKPFHNNGFHKIEMTPGPIVSIRDLSLEICRKPVLDRISFDLRNHEVLCLIGEKGAGKSVLLRCLNRTIEEQRGVRVQGRICLNSRDTMDPTWDLCEIRRTFALIPQTANPFPSSVWDNLAYVLKLHHLATSSADLKDRIEWALRSAGVWDQVKDRLHKDPAHQLPPMVQRLVCVARALVLKPKVLLLDEPNLGEGMIEPHILDPMLARITCHMPVLMTSPSLDIAAQAAGRIGYMTAGQLLEIDTAELLLTSPQNELTHSFVVSHR